MSTSPSPGRQLEKPIATDAEGESEFSYSHASSLAIAVTGVGAMLAIAVALVAVIISGTSEGDGAVQTGPTTPASTEWTIIATEFQFDPDAIAAPLATDVAVTVDNKGAVQHAWVVIKQGEEITTEQEFDQSKVLLGFDNIDPGATVSDTFQFDQGGTYQIICSIPGHFAAGMKGTLEVQS